MDNRIDVAYGRQSVDRKDSISIESQLEFCKHELRGGEFKAYVDKGFSGKNTDRPKFQEMIKDIKAGLIRRVVVYKLDRISRSILDFATLMEVFQEHNVEFVSSTEKFDTSTPMGRAMLNICIVFAQLERETIQKRVIDSCLSRSAKGFWLGGVTPYGFDTEPVTIGGVTTKKFKAKDDESDVVKCLYDMYAKPEVSLGDMVRYMAEKGIKFSGAGFQRATLTRLLRNPVYVQADMDIYEFYKSQGAIIINDAADFIGTNACYLYAGSDKISTTLDVVAGKTLVIAPHEGFVPSGIWLACRKKLLNNKSYQSARKAVNSWLTGKVKCGRCGFALKAIQGRFYCNKRAIEKNCEGAGSLKVADIEKVAYDEMVKKLQGFHTLAMSEAKTVNPKITSLKVELSQVEAEIDKLIETLSGASDILISYANNKIAELDSRKQSLIKQLAELAAEEVPKNRLLQISEILDNWEDTEINDKRGVVDSLIVKILTTSEYVDIQWKI